MPSGPLNPPNWAAPLEVRFEFEEDARHADRLHLLRHFRQVFPQVTEDRFVGRVADVGRDEVLEAFFVDDAGPGQPRIDLVILDVDPADVVTHGDIFVEDLHPGHVLGGEVAAVEYADQVRRVDLRGEFGEESSVLSDEVGFDFEAVDKTVLRTLVDDRLELLDGLIDVAFGGFGLRVVEGEAADELGAQGVGGPDRVGDFGLEVLVELNVLVVGARRRRRAASPCRSGSRCWSPTCRIRRAGP